MLIAVLALSAAASAQVWTPHKRVHAMSTTPAKTRKPATHPITPKKSKKKKTAKKTTKKRHHRSDDDFTYTEEDYPVH